MYTINGLIEELDPKTFEFIVRPLTSISKFSDYVEVAIESNGYDYIMAYVESEEQALKFNLVEDLNSGLYVTEGLLGNMFVRKWEQFPNQKYFLKLLELNPKSNRLSEGKDYTFGVEIETYDGCIPKYVRKYLAISSCYDGSIRDSNNTKSTGGEYVTEVLRYDIGFKHLSDILFEIARRCKINKTCSVHVHLGNMDFNQEFVVLAYKLGMIIQDEIYNIMPNSRRTNEYCQTITGNAFNYEKGAMPVFTDVKSIKKEDKELIMDKAYSGIVHEISGLPPGVKINKQLNHPAGRFCGYNRSTPRYWWLNFVPTLFTIEVGRKHTLEFRNHCATMNFEKIKNWILICMGIVSFIENYKEIIYNAKLTPGAITLSQIMLKTYPRKGVYLNQYISERKRKFSKEYSNTNAEADEYSQYENINPEPICLEMF